MKNLLDQNEKERRFNTYTSQTKSNNMKTEGANVLATLLSDQMTL